MHDFLALIVRAHNRRMRKREPSGPEASAAPLQIVQIDKIWVWLVRLRHTIVRASITRVLGNKTAGFAKLDRVQAIRKLYSDEVYRIHVFLHCMPINLLLVDRASPRDADLA